MVFDFVPRLKLLAATLVAAVGLCATNIAVASIIVPELQPFDEELVFAANSGEPYSTADAGDMRSPDEPSSESNELPIEKSHVRLKANCPTGSSTSGTSTASGFSSSGNMLSMTTTTLAAVGVGDCVGRLAGELALLLPAEISSSMFRPPRCA